MIFCQNCGTQLPENSVFCTKCGNKIGSITTKSNEPSTNNFTSKNNGNNNFAQQHNSDSKQNPVIETKNKVLIFFGWLSIIISLIFAPLIFEPIAIILGLLVRKTSRHAGLTLIITGSVFLIFEIIYDVFGAL